MSLDFCLYEKRRTEVFSRNITHNLTRMAREAGIYECLWCPDELDVKYAGQLVDPLTAGLALLKSDPERFKKFNASNGWGTYEHFVPFVEACLQACIDNPEAEVVADR